MAFSDLLRMARAPYDALQPLRGRFNRSIVAVMSLVFICAVSVVVGVAAWHTLVPQIFTMAEFSWVSVLALLMMLTGGVVSLRARATRSIAHVLYDTEHPSARRL
jgi:hypothetical protein